MCSCFITCLIFIKSHHDKMIYTNTLNCIDFLHYEFGVKYQYQSVVVVEWKSRIVLAMPVPMSNISAYRIKSISAVLQKESAMKQINWVVRVNKMYTTYLCTVSSANSALPASYGSCSTVRCVIQQ